jgi:hypothetical protein
MPVDLRVAILDGDESKVLGIVLPVVQSDERLNAWAQNLAVLGWLRQFVPQLAQPIIGIHGPAEHQREQLIISLSSPPAGEAVDPQAMPVVDAVATVDAVVVHKVPESAEADMAGTPPGADIPHAQSNDTTASHLDPDAP